MAVESNQTVNADELEEFFRREDGEPTYATEQDLQRIIPDNERGDLEELERYWVNKPYAFVAIFENTAQKENRYYVVEPTLTRTEAEIVQFLREKLKLAMPYEDDDEVPAEEREEYRRGVIREQAARLLKRYSLVKNKEPDSVGGTLTELVQSISLSLEQYLKDDENIEPDSVNENVPAHDLDMDIASHNIDDATEFDDIEADKAPQVSTGAANATAQAVTGIPRPVDDDGELSVLNKGQVDKVIYYLVRNFIGYRQTDPIKKDTNIEDIHCHGYNTRLHVTHSEYEKLITNVVHGKQELDDFVIHLAQQAGKGISKRQPTVDATLPDGSRAQLTLGKEVSDKGTNYTIRQFKDIPHTPIDLINWGTMNIEQMVYLWLAVENGKSGVFAGGTASGKTTTLNALSLFVPSFQKIVSIEDTRELEIPQDGWVASVTREAFSEGGLDDIDEFDLLQDALRQRPDYIVMGEVRGEEGRTLFQALHTGHTTYTTFHADSVGEVVKRFTSNPIEVPKPMFGSLDVILTQKLVRIDGKKHRRCTQITEIDKYDKETDGFQVDKAFEWMRRGDQFKQHGRSELMAEIQHQRGWTDDELEQEMMKRRVVLAYLAMSGIRDYASVAATIQAFIVDPDSVIALIAEGELENYISKFRNLKSIDIDIDDEREFDIPRPEADEEVREVCERILSNAEVALFPMYDSDDIELGASSNAQNNSSQTPSMTETDTVDSNDGSPPEGSGAAHDLFGGAEPDQQTSQDQDPESTSSAEESRTVDESPAEQSDIAQSEDSHEPAAEGDISKPDSQSQPGQEEAGQNNDGAVSEDQTGSESRRSRPKNTDSTGQSITTPDDVPSLVGRYIEQMVVGDEIAQTKEVLVTFTQSGNITQDATLKKVKPGHIEQFIGHVEASEEMFSKLNGGQTTTTINILSGFFGWCKVSGNIETNPVEEADIQTGK